TDIDDVSSFSLQHYFGGRLGAEEDGLQVHAVDVVPVLLFDIQRFEPCESCGVVDQGVDAAEVLGDAVHHRSDFGDLFHVGLEYWRVVAFLCCRAGFGFGGTVVNCYLRAFGGERKRDGASYALCRACYQYDLTVHCDLLLLLQVAARRSVRHPRPRLPRAAAVREVCHSSRATTRRKPSSN